MQEIMKQVVSQTIQVMIPVIVPVIVSGVVAGLGWLGKQVFTFLANKIRESNTKLDDYLAGLAVRWAEDKFGSGKGQEKLDAAKEWLIKSSKSKISDEQAEALVRAAYQSVFGNIGRLKNE